MQPQLHAGSVYEQYLARERQLAASASAGHVVQYCASLRCPAAWSGTEWDVCPVPFAHNAMDCDAYGELPPRGC